MVGSIKKFSRKTRVFGFIYRETGFVILSLVLLSSIFSSLFIDSCFLLSSHKMPLNCCCTNKFRTKFPNPLIDVVMVTEFDANICG